jgi:hypothetical protein
MPLKPRNRVSELSDLHGLANGLAALPCSCKALSAGYGINWPGGAWVTNLSRKW